MNWRHPDLASCIKIVDTQSLTKRTGGIHIVIVKQIETIIKAPVSSWATNVMIGWYSLESYTEIEFLYKRDEMVRLADTIFKMLSNL